MDAAEPVLEGMFNNIEEQELLFSALTPDSIVLEWGSGSSTISIAKRCKCIVSIEHDDKYFQWTYNEIRKNNLSNAFVYHVPRNAEEAPGHDGTFREYAAYAMFPYNRYDLLGPATGMTSKYDVILIDGRSRVACAFISQLLLKHDGFIFIHDYKNPVPEYRRPEYEVVEKFLKLESLAYAMAKFTVR